MLTIIYNIVAPAGLTHFANKPKEVLGDELQKWKGHSSP
jgi:hypothetical protein